MGKGKKRGTVFLDKKGGGKQPKTKVVDDKVDYISEMPEPVLHQIFSRLHAKDAGRMCILSKRWHQAWNAYQGIDFDLRQFHKMKYSKGNYKNMMNQMLKCREEQQLNITKFRLRFTSSKDLQNDVEGWIAAAIKRNVRDLEIQAKPFKNSTFLLPLSVFSGSSITALNLYGCILPTANIKLDLPLLQKLSLKKLNIPLKLLSNFFDSCPLIDELRLIQCTGLTALSIGNINKLRRVDVHKCDGLRSIVVENSKIESFWLFHDKKRLLKFDLSACTAIKDLVLEYARMTDEVFHDLILGFRDLEKLVLSKCHGLKRIELDGKKIRNLVIRKCRKLVQAQVDAPNLSSLEYRGGKMPFSFITPPSLKEAYFCFEPSSKAKIDFKTDEYSRLHNFLYECSNSLKLTTLNKEAAVIYEDLRVLLKPLDQIKKSHTVKLSTQFDDLLKEALQTWPYPRTLSVTSHKSSEFPEVIYKELNQGKSNPECCAYFQNKCWKHYLKGISHETVFPMTSSLLEDSKDADLKKTTFTLVWNIDKHGRRKEITPMRDGKSVVT